MDDQNLPDQQQGDDTDKTDAKTQTIVFRALEAVEVIGPGSPPPGTHKVVVPYWHEPTDLQPIYIAVTPDVRPAKEDWKPALTDLDHTGCRPGSHTGCRRVVFARFPDGVTGDVWIKDRDGVRPASEAPQPPAGANPRKGRVGPGWIGPVMSSGLARLERAAAGATVDPAADWLLALRGLGGRYSKEVEDQVRIAALERIWPKDKVPFHPNEWRIHSDRLLAALDDVNRKLAEAIRDSTPLAAAEAIESIPPVTSQEAKTALTELYKSVQLTSTEIDWIALNDARLRTRFRTALSRLVAREGILDWRRKARHVAPPDDSLPAEDPFAEWVEAYSEWAFKLRRAGLSVGERGAVDLKVQGFDDREIARRLNTSWGAVRERLRSARAKIDAVDNPS